MVICDMKVIAKSRYISVSPRKLRLIAGTVQGRQVEDALTQLRFFPSPSAKELAKVVKAASANAENNHQLSVAGLKVVKIDIGDGPRLKRLRPQPRGRAHMIVKHSSHVVVTVEGDI